MAGTQMEATAIRRRQILWRDAARHLVTPPTAFAVLAISSIAWLMHEGRSTTFQDDEWSWLLYRRGTSLEVFLRPHNEHLSVIPIAIYKAFLQIFGMSSSAPFRLLDALLVAVCAGLTFVLARRRVGGWAALAPAAVLLFFGPAWRDIIWGFQIGYLGSLAAGLGAFLALERRDRRGDAVACLLLTISVSCSSVGLALLVGAIVEIALSAGAQGWRRLWVVAVPTELYAVWYHHYGVSSIHLSHAHDIPTYAFTGLAAVAGSLTGLTAPDVGLSRVSIHPGTTIAVLLLVALGIRFVRGAPLSSRFWALAVAAIAFWAAAELSFVPGREANQGRYTLPVAPLVVLAAFECCAGWRPSRRSLLLLGGVSVVAIGSNLGFLNRGAHLFDLASQYAKAELGALEVSRGVVAPSFSPETRAIVAVIGAHDMGFIDAGSYFSAIDAFGSPADSVATILAQPEPVREAADYVLALAERLAPVHRGQVTPACAIRQPSGGGIELTANPGSTVVVAAGSKPVVTMAARRFALAYKYVALGAVRDERRASITLPRDRSTLPWHIRLFTTGQVTVCGPA
jgi:hypothetical protein